MAYKGDNISLNVLRNERLICDQHCNIPECDHQMPLSGAMFFIFRSKGVPDVPVGDLMTAATVRAVE